jgi:TRAP-type uncharacterized transport system fused permease subunit
MEDPGVSQFFRPGPVIAILWSCFQIYVEITGFMHPMLLYPIHTAFAIALAKSYRSPWAGTQMSLGHAVIEVPLILLIYFGFARFFESVTVQLMLSVLGGAMIIWMGITMFRARAKVVQKGNDLPYGAFAAGVLTSGFNPYFLLWWATIGSMSIPMMVSSGYKPKFAAAVEAVAGTGGQFMPPVMGGSVFLMMEILGVSYYAICRAAVLSAILYYVAIFFIVDFEAVKNNLKGAIVKVETERAFISLVPGVTFHSHLHAQKESCAAQRSAVCQCSCETTLHFQYKIIAQIRENAYGNGNSR